MKTAPDLQLAHLKLAELPCGAAAARQSEHAVEYPEDEEAIRVEEPGGNGTIAGARILERGVALVETDVPDFDLPPPWSTTLISRALDKGEPLRAPR